MYFISVFWPFPDFWSLISSILKIKQPKLSHLHINFCLDFQGCLVWSYVWQECRRDKVYLIFVTWNRVTKLIFQLIFEKSTMRKYINIWLYFYWANNINGTFLNTSGGSSSGKRQGTRFIEGVSADSFNLNVRSNSSVSLSNHSCNSAGYLSVFQTFSISACKNFPSCRKQTIQNQWQQKYCLPEWKKRHHQKTFSSNEGHTIICVEN